MKITREWSARPPETGAGVIVECRDSRLPLLSCFVSWTPDYARERGEAALRDVVERMERAMAERLN